MSGGVMEAIRLKDISKDDLRLLSVWKVPVIVDAGELVKLFDFLEETAHLRRMNRNDDKRQQVVPMTEACRMYELTAETLVKRAKEGSIIGYKIGGRWYFETPEVNRERLNKLQTYGKSYETACVRASTASKTTV